MRDAPTNRPQAAEQQHHRRVNSVLQDWVMALPLRHQGVLLTSVRGCDGMPKESTSKQVSRALRYAFLVPADKRETYYRKAFMTPLLTAEEAKAFLKDLDFYPWHFITHIMHAAQVLGYKHPDADVRLWWQAMYNAMVEACHLKPETEEEMDKRLLDDRAEEIREENCSG